jgi:hypothetical protein
MKYQPPYAEPGTINPNAPYVDDDKVHGIDGSVPPAASMEYPQRELVNLIGDSGQTPDDEDLHQAARAARDSRLIYAVDTGPIDHVEIADLTPSLAGFGYQTGLEVHVRIAHTITGPSDLAIGGLNPIAIKRRDGSDLQANDMLGGQIVILIFDGTFFQLFSGLADSSGGAAPDRYEIYLPYVHDTGTANHVIALYVPTLPDVAEHRTVLVKLANNVTGPCDFKPNNFPVYPVTHPDGSPIKAGDGVINQIWLLCFDGVQWQMLSNYALPGKTPGPQGSFKSLQFMNPSAGAIQTYPNGSCPYLFRNPSAAGNRTVWTWSAFIKYPIAQDKPYYYPGWYNDQSEALFTAGSGASGGDLTGAQLIGGDVDQCLNLYWNNALHPVSGCSDPTAAPIHQGTFTWGVLKDSKWHHILVHSDGANITCYIDGIPISFGPISANGAVSSTETQVIGSASPAFWYCARCRMAEINFIDGFCLGWPVFANDIAGQFVPKIYTGAFGAQGYYLNWKNATAVTETTLGADQSPNKNNFTPVNFNLTQVLTDFPGNPKS